MGKLCVECVNSGQSTKGEIKYYAIPGWGGPVGLCEAHAPTKDLDK